MPKPISKKRRASSILRGGVLAVDSEGNAMFPQGDPRNEIELAKRRRPSIISADTRDKGVSGNDKTLPSRPKVVVGTTNVKGALKRNIKNQINKIPSDIVVINERVQLDETNFVPNEGQNLGFSYEYFPPKNGVMKTPKEIIAAKVVFANVFRPTSEFSLINPKPPCDIDEYGILREGLSNRLERIRVQVRAGKRNEGLSIRVRALMEQGIKMKKLLDDMVENVENCGNYQGETQVAINKISNINDDQIRRLIRNFSFLVLQALNPIEGYDDKMAVDPVDLVNVLDNTDFTESDMNDYLNEYQELHPIPRLIGIILSDTKTQKSMLNLMLETEKKNLIQSLMSSITSKLEGTPSANAFATFQATLGGEDSNSKMMNIIGWVVDEIKRSSDAKAIAEAKIIELRSAGVILQARLAELETEKSAVDLQLNEAQAINNSNAAIPVNPVDKATHDALKIDKETNDRDIIKLNETILELQKELEKCRAEIETTKSEIVKTSTGQTITQDMFNKLTGLLKDTEDELEKVTLENGRLKGELDNLKAEKEGYLTKIRVLENNSNTPLSTEERARLEGEIEELKVKVEECDNKIQKISELEAKLQDVTSERNQLNIASTGLKQQVDASASLAESVQREIDQLKNEIIALKEQNDILKEPVVNKVDTLTEQIKDISKQQNDNNMKIQNGTVELETAIAMLPTMDPQLQATKQNEIAALRVEIDSLSATNSNLAKTNAKLKEELNRLSGVTSDDAIKQAELLAQKEAQIITLERDLIDLKGEINKNTVITSSKDTQIDDANSVTSALRERVKKLAEALQSGDSDALRPFTHDTESGFSELLKVVAEKTRQSQVKSDSTDICYLNYFVSFFIRELFFTEYSANSEVQDNKSQIINYVNSVNDSKALLDLIFIVLKSDERSITDETLRIFLRKQGNISKKLQEIYKIKFPEFYKNVNEITYTVSNPLTPMATIENKRTLTHLTLFTYFLFIARKYLLDNTDQMSGCKINKYITDISNQINTNSGELTAVETISTNLNSTAESIVPSASIPTLNSVSRSLSTARSIRQPRAGPGSTPGSSRKTTPVAENEEDPPDSSNAKTIRLILIDSSKSKNRAISGALKDDLKLTGEDTSVLENINKAKRMQNFITRYKGENDNYGIITRLASKLNMNKPPNKDEYAGNDAEYEKAYEKFVSDSILHGYNSKVSKPIKRFLLDLMKAYILSYKVQNVAPGDTNGKLDALYPDFERILNPILNDKKDLFKTIGISKDLLKRELDLA